MISMAWEGEEGEGGVGWAPTYLTTPPVDRWWRAISPPGNLPSLQHLKSHLCSSENHCKSSTPWKPPPASGG